MVTRLLLVSLESFVWFKVCSASLSSSACLCWRPALYKDFLVSFLPFLRESLFLTYPRFLLAVWGETEPDVRSLNETFRTKLHVRVGRKRTAHLFGRILLLGAVGSPEFVLHTVSVLQLFHLVNPHQPVLRRERLLQVLQLYILVADLGVARPIEARRRPEVQLEGMWHDKVAEIFPSGTPAPIWPAMTYLHFSEAVVGHFVHQAVEQRGGAGFIHSELSLRGEVITFLRRRKRSNKSALGHFDLWFKFTFERNNFHSGFVIHRFLPLRAHQTFIRAPRRASPVNISPPQPFPLA